MSGTMTFLGRDARMRASFLGIAFALVGCNDASTGSEPLAGGSSDQGNAVRIAVTDRFCRPLAGAVVKLRRFDWISGGSLEAGRYADGRTDAQGRLEFDSLFSGDYRIEAYDDSLEGVSATISVNNEVEVDVVAKPAATIVLDGLASGRTAALQGVDRPMELLPDGRIQFRHAPAVPLSVIVQGGSSETIVVLPPASVGSRIVFDIAGSEVRVDSGKIGSIDPSLFSTNLVGAQVIDFHVSDLSRFVQGMGPDGAWNAISNPLTVDSVQAGWFRLAGDGWTSAATRLRWMAWPFLPGLRYGWEANGADSLDATSMTSNGAILATDTSLAYARMDTTQWIDFGSIADTSIAEGSLEFLFRPGAGFSPDKAYLLLGQDGARLSVGYLRGSIFFLKSTDYTYRWAITRPGQLSENRWYRILATWGPQGMTISVDDTLRAWNADVTGYSRGSGDTSQLHLVSGKKSSACCMEGIGIRSPLKLDGDIASIRMRDLQPMVWKIKSPHACPDSVAGDLLQRCGILSSTNINDGRRPSLY